ncbi:unnamed protein product [Linum tenue]|uniref:Uncharacterized protein n=1 Tax=Linum tenue TaxID=586396 RepID=A0AAV0LLP3_9ROSI|nr:unnamed protein product [Linum tenue]CAI0460957.1 unnamed protein product [Linum tenue]CAI0559206.1 unnamed protein product [Linum tenue]
MEKGDLLFQL